jgi:hypothetical protein
MRVGDDVSLIVSQSMDLAAETMMGIGEGMKSRRWVKTGQSVTLLSAVRLELVAELANDEAVVRGAMNGVHYLCDMRDLRRWH